ncbi:MAG: UDP-N-acetylmuramate dehydrogenase [Deltaproteobacteria bacterium]|nr:UDP-N-acetylmuramate dehydrogenase [Deltaproteobacteria bacterium]
MAGSRGDGERRCKMQDARCKIKNKTYNLQLATCNFKGRMLFDVPMKDYTSFKIGGNAEVMAFPKNENDLISIIGFAASKGFPIFVFGRGTNLLVMDNGIKGVVINLSEGFKKISWEENDTVAVGAGVMLVELVNLCKDRGLSGLEFAIGIPGTIGGAVVMNAGAYGSEIKDVIERVEAVDISGKKHSFDKSTLNFSYRKCSIPENMVITKAYLKLKKTGMEEIQDRVKEFKDRRKTTRAINMPNAGSIFKNPHGLLAGKLIEEAGLKGIRVGGAQISEIHANYIVNLGNATAMDVLTLLSMIRDRVFKTKGVLLETEIQVVGED